MDLEGRSVVTAEQQASITILILENENLIVSWVLGQPCERLHGAGDGCARGAANQAGDQRHRTSPSAGVGQVCHCGQPSQGSCPWLTHNGPCRNGFLARALPCTRFLARSASCSLVRQRTHRK